MHCVLNYPTPYPNAHLAAIRHLRAAFFEHPIGYSDHTRPDPSMVVLQRAYELGATVIEKHFTHDKSLPGNDHYHAMNAADVAIFRRNIGLLHEIEGEERKHVLPEEEISRKNARRSLVAARNLPAGHTLVAGDLAVKRPAFGLPTSALEWVIGKKLKTQLQEDDFLTVEHLLG
jgi:N-acetylneuraminate synthase